jgi:hypothetical protein
MEVIMLVVYAASMDFSRAAAQATCGEAKEVPLSRHSVKLDLSRQLWARMELALTRITATL